MKIKEIKVKIKKRDAADSNNLELFLINKY